jgi:ADP-ribose pyrophosphatase
MPPEPPREVTIDSRTGYDGGLLRVRVDDVRLPSGRASRREVVEHPGAVAIVAVTADKHLLLVRQYRHATARVLLELPAGTREPGESAIETARRELIEETGYAPGDLGEVLTFFPTPGYSAEQITLFRADDCYPVEHERDAEEATRVVRVPLVEVPSLIAPGSNQVADGKTLIGLLWLLRDGAVPAGRS